MACEVSETKEWPNLALQSDRCAREIVRFLMLFLAARSRRLNAMPLGGGSSSSLADKPQMLCSTRYTLLNRFDRPAY